ncbi:sugar ABC transporter permease [Marmoricola endophyticus]|uniref:Sugar ABC transporter permease n=1 Tax=Marmoricola endophyticus TaxID=2040280 RepID=A0A917BNQ7_9ACTN|nr:ABC transporter permease [Marmoricola endophyticus]GGF51110.1 sugar ABC transporter permease [Marmoricola endophyticus]
MAEATVTSAPTRSTSVSGWLRVYGVYAALVVVLVINLLFTDNFFAVDNFRIQLVQVVPVLVVALGMALVIGTEGIDLSVGAVMALAAAVIPLWLGYGVVPAVLVALVAGLVVGLVNGGVIAFIGVQPIVATLALMVGGRGIALVISGEQLKSIQNQDLRSLGTAEVAGIPLIVVIAAVLAVLVWLLVSSTTYGRQLVAVGGNRRAAELSGLPVKRVLITAYVLCALLASIAGVIGVARAGASVPSTLGNLIELSAITAVVVGGTPLSGGQVRVWGTVAGALLLQLIDATLIKHDVPDSYSQIVQAVIIVIAVFVQRGKGVRS